MAGSSRGTESFDVEERSVTVAFQSFFASVAQVGATEDLLSLVCKCIVGHSHNVLFAFYCYEDDETGQIAARKHAVDLRLPSPEVQRKLVTYIRRLTGGGRLAAIEPSSFRELLGSDKCNRCGLFRGLGVDVTDGTRPVAILAVFFAPDFVVHDYHRAWMRLYSQTASTLVSRQSELRRVQNARNEALRTSRQMALRMEAARAAVRKLQDDMARAKESIGEEGLLPRDVLKAGESGARRVAELLDGKEGEPFGDGSVLLDGDLDAWVDEGLGDSRLKAIVGLRGTGKSTVLHSVRARVLAAGVPEDRIVTIDFENARFRRFKTAGDVIAYLESFPESSRPLYLFLDEVGMVGWHRELLKRLRNFGRWNVWLTASSAHTVVFPDGEASKSAMRVYRLWSDPKHPRSHGDLERIWCQSFMRDMANGVDHPDIRAKELLAEYFSDHLGEVTSLRTVSRELDAMGRHLAKSSISAYRQALEEAFVIEMSEVYCAEL